MIKGLHNAIYSIVQISETIGALQVIAEHAYRRDKLLSELMQLRDEQIEALHALIEAETKRKDAA